MTASSRRFLFLASTFSLIALGGCSGDSTHGAAGSGGSGAGVHDHGVVTPPNGNPIEVIPDPPTALPKIDARLTNVAGSVYDDSVQITFDPVDGAVDYRIYPLPKDGAIATSGGIVTVKDGTYRCAGAMEKSFPNSDDGVAVPPDNVTDYGATTVMSDVGGYTRTMEEATLGYVYPEAGKGRVPVWALGNPDHNADVFACANVGYGASRLKKYTASETEYQRLVDAGWRDDGIQFYVPEGGSGTKSVYTVATEPDAGGYFTALYFTSPKEHTARAASNPAEADFVVLDEPAPGTQPLMRVYQTGMCYHASHDELAVGKSRFDAIYYQGNHPANSLLWTGLEEPTVLVVEALSSGCPYQGMMAATHIDFPDHETYVTVDDMRKASKTGEVFVNGQYDTDAMPKAIARTYIKAEPQEQTMDFFDGFHEAEVFQPAEPDSFEGATVPCATMVHMTNAKYDLSAYCIQDIPDFLISAGSFLGQFWVTYADNFSDANGKIRLQPKQHAELSETEYLHATMSIDSVSTARRYPQLIISDQFYPVQKTMQKGHAVVVQTRGIWPPALEVQFCDHQEWDVNNQCDGGGDPPAYPGSHLYPLFASTDQGATDPLPPVAHLGEQMTTDRANRYDVYVSTKRAYVFLDGKPYGCADLPSGKLKPGKASVTFGDVLYHGGADIIDQSHGLDWIYLFHVRHLAKETRRHYDNLGFSSHVGAPKWDEKLLPCRTVN